MGALIEASEFFSKRINGSIQCSHSSFQNFFQCEVPAYLDTIQAPLVIKADGLCAGKGVT